MNPTFWKGKKVLVTGHTGFKGSWLALWLKYVGADVVGISMDPLTSPNLYKQLNIAEGMTSLRQDIRDGEAIKEIFQKYQPEIVFHLAAQPLVRYSYKEPLETYETNVMGSLHILEGVRSIESVKAVVIITTDKCYENKEWAWGYRENEPMGGHDPYSSSKGAAELLIASYRKSYFSTSKEGQHKAAIASVRAGNVIGGGDRAEDRLIPDIVRAFQKNKPVQIRSPNSIRPWQHVLEPLSGYLLLAEKLIENGKFFSQAWNFGPLEGDSKSVQSIVEKMVLLWGEGASWVIDDNYHPHEANYLKLDCTKAHNYLHWWPKWDLDYALKKIVEWHQIEHAGKNLKDTCINQINEYMGFSLNNG